MEKKKTIKKITPKKAVKSKLSLNILGVNGEVNETFDLPETIFGLTVNPRLLAQYVRAHMINVRQGNAFTKTRSEVIGSTKKIYKQKGTGRARHGDIKAPIFVGGGVVGGPKPRELSAKVNKKQKIMALKYSLSAKAQSSDLVGAVDALANIKPKTKTAYDFLKNSKLIGRKVLIVLTALKNEGITLAARNVTGVTLVQAHTLNAYDVMQNNKILFVGTALSTIIERLDK